MSFKTTIKKLGRIGSEKKSTEKKSQQNLNKQQQNREILELPIVPTQEQQKENPFYVADIDKIRGLRTSFRQLKNKNRKNHCRRTSSLEDFSTFKDKNKLNSLSTTKLSESSKSHQQQQQQQLLIPENGSELNSTKQFASLDGFFWVGEETYYRPPESVDSDIRRIEEIPHIINEKPNFPKESEMNNRMKNTAEKNLNEKINRSCSIYTSTKNSNSESHNTDGEDLESHNSNEDFESNNSETHNPKNEENSNEISCCKDTKKNSPNILQTVEKFSEKFLFPPQIQEEGDNSSNFLNFPTSPEFDGFVDPTGEIALRDSDCDSLNGRRKYYNKKKEDSTANNFEKLDEAKNLKANSIKTIMNNEFELEINSKQEELPKKMMIIKNNSLQSKRNSIGFLAFQDDFENDLLSENLKQNENSVEENIEMEVLKAQNSGINEFQKNFSKIEGNSSTKVDLDHDEDFVGEKIENIKRFAASLQSNSDEAKKIYKNVKKFEDSIVENFTTTTMLSEIFDQLNLTENHSNQLKSKISHEYNLKDNTKNFENVSIFVPLEQAPNSPLLNNPEIQASNLNNKKIGNEQQTNNKHEKEKKEFNENFLIKKLNSNKIIGNLENQQIKNFENDKNSESQNNFKVYEKNLNGRQSIDNVVDNKNEEIYLNQPEKIEIFQQKILPENSGLKNFNIGRKSSENSNISLNVPEISNIHLKTLENPPEFENPIISEKELILVDLERIINYSKKEGEEEIAPKNDLESLKIRSSEILEEEIDLTHYGFPSAFFFKFDDENSPKSSICPEAMDKAFEFDNEKIPENNNINNKESISASTIAPSIEITEKIATPASEAKIDELYKIQNNLKNVIRFNDFVKSSSFADFNKNSKSTNSTLLISKNTFLSTFLSQAENANTNTNTNNSIPKSPSTTSLLLFGTQQKLEEYLKSPIKIKKSIKTTTTNDEKEFLTDSKQKQKKKERKICFEEVDLKRIYYEKLVFKEDDEISFQNLDNQMPNYELRSWKETFINYFFCRKDLLNKKQTIRPASLKQLLKNGSRMDKLLIAVGILMAILCGFCQALFAIILGRLFDVFLLDSKNFPLDFLTEPLQILIIFLGIGSMLCFFGFIQYLCFNISCKRIVRKIRVQYLRAILRQEPAWFDKNQQLNKNKTDYKIYDHIERISEGIGLKFGILIRAAAHFLLGFILAVLTNWQLGLLMWLFAPIIAFLIATSTKRTSDKNKVGKKAYAEAGFIAEEAIYGYRTVAAFNAQSFEVRQYKNALNLARKTRLYKFGLFYGFVYGFALFLSLIFIGMTVLVGSYFYELEIIHTPGQIFAIMLTVLSGAYQLGIASTALPLFIKARISAAVVYGIINRIPDLSTKMNNGHQIYGLNGQIIFKNVSFRHPINKDYPRILKKFSFTVHPGQIVAILGPSDCGKCVISKILNRFYDYQSGSVTIDGQEIRKLNANWLRTICGTIQPKAIIFNDTIENNIRFGCETTLNQTQIFEACDAVGMHGFVDGLPDGYQTRIGPDSETQLSTAQKQRIAIARVLARNPVILIIDESDEIYDDENIIFSNELIIQQILKSSTRKRATLIITNRISTAKYAEKIIVMSNGRFVEKGTHQELISRRGIYTNMAREQNQLKDEPKSVSSSESSTPPKDLSMEEHEPNHELQEVYVKKSIVHRNSQLPALGIAEIAQKTEHVYQREFSCVPNNLDIKAEILKLQLIKENGISFPILHLFMNYWPKLLIGVFLCAFNSLVLPMVLIGFNKLFQSIYFHNDIVNFNISILCFLYFNVLGLVFGLTFWAAIHMFEKISQRVVMDLRVQTFRNILAQNGAYFDEHTPQKLVNRLAFDAQKIQASMDLRLCGIIQGICFILTGLIFAILIETKFTLICIILFLLQALLQIFVYNLLRQKQLEISYNNDAEKIAMEAIKNVRTIQLFTAEDTVQERFLISSNNLLHKELLNVPLEAINFILFYGCNRLTFVICYVFGYFFVQNEMVSKIGMLIVAQILYIGVSRIGGVSDYFFREFVKSRLAISLFFNTINRSTSSKIQDSKNKDENFVIEGNIYFNDVYFGYPITQKNIVLKGINIKIPTGSTLLIMGPHRSGKSTLLALIERFYEPSCGNIQIDGNDIRDFSLRALRQQIALVEQNPILFAGKTIKENISYGMDQDLVDINTVIEVAVASNCSDFIAKLPLGYDTIIGEENRLFPEPGQRQRIALARALFKKPKILLLDELTDNLDFASEKLIMEAMDKASLGRTCVRVLGLRRSNFDDAKKQQIIIWLENGQIKEYGTHEQLIDQQGKYHRMFKKFY